MSYFCNILIFSVYLPFPVTKLKLMFENVICFFCIRFSTRHEKLRTKTWQIGIKSCGSIGQKFRVSVVLIKLMVRTYLFMQTSVLCYCLPRVVTFFLLLEMHFCTCKESQSVCSWMWTVLLLLGMSHTHPFNGSLYRTIRVSRYQKGKTDLDFTEARDSEWQWHPLGHMQVCTSLQSDNHASTPPLSFYRSYALPVAQPTV